MCEKDREQWFKARLKDWVYNLVRFDELEARVGRLESDMNDIHPELTPANPEESCKTQ